MTALHLNVLYWIPIPLYMIRDQSENITGGGVGFSIFVGDIWVPSSEDWQNLGTPTED